MKKTYIPYFPELAKNINHFKLNKKPLFNLTYHLSIDKKGIIFVDFGLLEGNQKMYFPITLQQYSITNYNLFFETNDDSYKKIFLDHAQFLMNLISLKEDYAFWKIKRKMNIAGYNFKKPYNWVSSIVQGYGLSVFIRAHSLTNNKKYLDLGNKIVNSFEWKTEEGGFLDIDKNGNYWYEEFPVSKHAHVLNGFIYSLLGLYEYYEYTKYKKAKKLFDLGVKTLIEQLEYFELKSPIMNWSKYDTGKIFYSGRDYHNKVHLPQLKILYAITKNKIFLKYFKRWSKYSKKYDFITRIINFPLLAFIKMRGFLNI